LDSPLTFYVGASGGGVWKSVDGGLSYKPIFDEHNQSIGALALDPRNPKTLWVGTGEAWTRNSVSVGDGGYKTADAGDSWEKMGLPDSEHIARIAVHPTDGNTVWVCATGHLWDGNEERGVYRTTDGGKSWKRTLFVDPDTGCSDLAVDPQDPRIVYAGMWQFRRFPWAFRSGGPGSGLYKSTDGGLTWRAVKTGLPTGDQGRIAVALAPPRPAPGRGPGGPPSPARRAGGRVGQGQTPLPPPGGALSPPPAWWSTPPITTTSTSRVSP